MRVSEARNILISVHDDVIKLGDIYQILKWFECMIVLSEKMGEFLSTEEYLKEACDVCRDYSIFDDWFYDKLHIIITNRAKNDIDHEASCKSIKRTIASKYK